VNPYLPDPSGYTPILPLGEHDGRAWSLVMDDSGTPWVHWPDGSYAPIPLGDPPPVPEWPRIVAHWLDTETRRAPELRPPLLVEQAVRRAYFAWTTDLREYFVIHAPCGHDDIYRLRGAESPVWAEHMAKHACEACRDVIHGDYHDYMGRGKVGECPEGCWPCGCPLCRGQV
jgi:hypothetical protein